MVESTIRSALKTEHQIEQMVESSTDGSTDSAEKEFHELRRMTKQAALSAIKAIENWGKQALAKSKEITEEIHI